MPDYAQALAQFSWAAARERLDGLSNGGLNIAYEAIDGRVARGAWRRTRPALARGRGGAIDYAYDDLDSMDFLNYVTSIHERLGVNVPQSDCAKVATISGALAYLTKALAGAD